MQPFDALSIRAVLHEAKQLLLNRRVEKVSQLARDELLIALRSKGGTVNLFLSAQSVYGRMCLVRIPSSSDSSEKSAKERTVFDRYNSKYGSQTPPNFCLVLRKCLSSSTLVGIEQLAGERIVDFVFSCVDEVGGTSHKILTAEIMGRHSNLIFWDKESKKILAASHVVTREMSRQREVLPGLVYSRPPGQDRPNIFGVTREEFKSKLENLLHADKEEHSHQVTEEAGDNGNELQEDPGGEGDDNGNAAKSESSQDADTQTSGHHLSVGDTERTVADTKQPKQESSQRREAVVVPTFEHWLVSTFTGLGKHLSEEIVAGTKLGSIVSDAPSLEECEEKLWEKVRQIQHPLDYSPSCKNDLSRYSILGWYQECDDEAVWKKFPSVNDLVEQYFRSLEAREMFVQLREKIKAEILSESSKLEARKQTASDHLTSDSELARLKESGDMILASLAAILPGQTDLVVAAGMVGSNGEELTIKLNPDITSVQNAQAYYRIYAKQRARQNTARTIVTEVGERLDYLNKLRALTEDASEISDLRKVKETLTGRDRDRQGQAAKKPRPGSGGKNKTKIHSVSSSDGWTIYVGRNRMENDYLLANLANPNDFWFHVLGQGGAHVLVRLPGSKQTPPKTTIMEAAQIAARMSKAAAGSKVKVVYTQVKFVHKLGRNKPGQVRYENEKTIEVNTAVPLPQLMKKLFQA